MQRRHVMALSLATAAAGVAAQSSDAPPAHHHAEGAGPFGAVADSSGRCVATGETCLAHCLMLLGMGDTSMADCSRAVNQMLALCGALQSLAAQGSRLLPALARVAQDACLQCQDACKPHADKHAPCKACMEACIECARQCKSVAA